MRGVHRNDRRVQLRKHLVDDVKPVRLPIGERPQENGVVEAIDGRDGPDAHGQGEDRHQGEPGAFAQRSGRIANVSDKQLERRHRASLVARLSRLYDSPEPQHRDASRLVRRDAASDAVVDVMLEVTPKLIGKFLLARCHAK